MYQSGELDDVSMDFSSEESSAVLPGAGRNFVADDGGAGVAADTAGDLLATATEGAALVVMPRPVTTISPESGNEFADAFINNGRHYVNAGGSTGPVNINYFFDKLPGPVNPVTGRGTPYDWRPCEKQQWREAIEGWSDVANVTFTEVFTAEDALFRERLQDQATTGGTVSASHSLPSANVNAQSNGTYNFEAVNVLQWTPDQIEPGGNFHRTFIHEVGHGLGLKHPHDSGSLAFQPNFFPGIDPSETSAERQRSLGVLDLNHMFGSVMSYIHGYEFDDEGRIQAVPTRQRPVADDFFLDHGFAATPMAYDIAATQYLYGANMTFRTEDNVYLLPDSNDPAPFVRGEPNEAGVPESIIYQPDVAFWEAIWDAGGIDEMRYDGSASVILDLTAATLDMSATSYGVLSYAAFIGGGYTIANGVVIENATGGQGNDEITGNAADNRLLGCGGDDMIRGGAGNDVLDGGEGVDITIGGAGDDIHIVDDARDVVIEEAGGGNDVIIVTGAGYRLPDTVGVLLGTGLAQRLEGNSGDNIAGRDTFTFHSTDTAGAATIADFGRGEDLLRLLGFAIDTADEALAALAQDGSDTRLDLGAGTTVLLAGVVASQLTAGDFLFA